MNAYPSGESTGDEGGCNKLARLLCLNGNELTNIVDGIALYPAKYLSNSK
jgi:hypothetical protein